MPERASAIELLNEMEHRGMMCRVLSTSHLKELGDWFQELLSNDLIDREPYDLYMAKFKFIVPEELPQARSIVIVADPQPQYMVAFNFRGGRYPLLVPPTYAKWTATEARVLAAFRAMFGETPGFIRAILPLKTLAGRSGLVKYGRNNVTYVPRYGSFHRLFGAFTDLEFDEDHWQDFEMLDRCDSCGACVRSCPTGAIDEGRFVIRASKCLTFLNELPSERQFPHFVNRELHHTVIGCMKCQNVCPYDKDVRGWMEKGVEFSEEETEFLLKGDFSNKPDGLEGKLDEAGLDLTIFPRNLRVLLDREG